MFAGYPRGVATGNATKKIWKIIPREKTPGGISDKIAGNKSLSISREIS